MLVVSRKKFDAVSDKLLRAEAERDGNGQLLKEYQNESWAWSNAVHSMLNDGLIAWSLFNECEQRFSDEYVKLAGINKYKKD